MQRTAQQLCQAALKLLGVLGAGDPIEPEQFGDVCEMLNMLLDSWSIKPFLSISRPEVSFPMTGAIKYTWGPGGDFDDARPVMPLHVRLRDGGGGETPVSIRNYTEWGDIGNKSIEGRPSFCWYDDSVPLGTLRFSAVVPSLYTMKAVVHYPFVEFTLPTDVLVMPEGYYEAIVYNLAQSLQTMFSKTMKQDDLVKAKISMDTIRLNRMSGIYTDSLHKLGYRTGAYDVINFRTAGG